MILEEGLQSRYERHRICAEAVYNSMEALGLDLMAEAESRSHTVAAVACPEGIDDGKLRELIRIKYGIDLGGSLERWKGKMFRIGIIDRKSTRLNSSHITISYAVFCLKKKKK